GAARRRRLRRSGAGVRTRGSGLRADARVARAPGRQRGHREVDMIERFTVPDELTCYYDRQCEPANVHLEARIPGRLDETAVRASMRSVLASEPRLLARRLRAGSWQRSYFWEFPVTAWADPLQAVTYADQAGLDRLRDAFLSQSPPLDVAPPLLFLLASGPGGDWLILNAHHACFDGLSCLRLL